MADRLMAAARKPAARKPKPPKTPTSRAASVAYTKAKNKAATKSAVPNAMKRLTKEETIPSKRVTWGRVPGETYEKQIAAQRRRETAKKSGRK